MNFSWINHCQLSEESVEKLNCIAVPLPCSSPLDNMSANSRLFLYQNRNQPNLNIFYIMIA